MNHLVSKHYSPKVVYTAFGLLRGEYLLKISALGKSALAALLALVIVFSCGC